MTRPLHELLRQLRMPPPHLSDGFRFYTVNINETPDGFLIFIGVYVLCSFVFLIPVALWNRYKRNQTQKVDAEPGEEMVRIEATADGPTLQQQQEMRDRERGQVSDNGLQVAVKDMPTTSFTQTDRAELPSTTFEMAPPNLQNGSRSPSKARNNPTPMEESGSEIRGDGHTSQDPSFFQRQRQEGRLVSPGAMSSEQCSVTPSAATTSRLRTSASSVTNSRVRSRAFLRVSDVGAKLGLTQNHHPSQARAQAIRHFVHAERESAAAGGDEASATSRSRDPSWLMAQRHGLHHRSMSQSQMGRMSDAAGGVLTGEIIDGESDFYRQRYVERSRRNRMRSLSIAGSDFSIMPPLNSEALRPEDAADANDPGRGNPVPFFDAPPRPRPQFPKVGVWTRCSGFLDCVEPDGEMRRILRLAIPSIAGGVADRFLRLVLIGIISYYINTASMVAFVLVTNFLRLTIEAVSGAITDTEVINIQNALASGGDDAYYRSGQIIKLSLIVQTLIGVPILVGWVFGISGLVNWLLSGVAPEAAQLAAEYTQVIVFDYYFRVAGKTFLVPFHMNGRAPFENIIDVVGAVLTMIAIGVVVGSELNVGDRPTLVSVAWIQVIASFVKVTVKVSYVCFKGWFQPYREGFFGRFALSDARSVYIFIVTAIPLFIGSLIELREWEILTLFVRAVGPGEVTTWVVMGAVWELFEASTDGLGGAGAMRISYYLAENQPDEARIISFKVVFLAAIQAFSFSSIFLMLGPNLSVWLLKDPVLENMFYHLVGMTAVANFTMTFALTEWSLVATGQGRFGYSTACIVLSRWLVVYPVASICVFRFDHEVTSVAASIAIGYATAGYALGCMLIRSDWKQLAQETHDELFPPDDPEVQDMGHVGEDDGESEDDDDDDSIIL